MKNSNILIAAIAFLVIASAVIFMSGEDETPQVKTASVASSASQLTITGISPTQVISNDAELQTANMLITAVADGGGQSIVGELSATSATQKLTNLVVQYPLRIEISNIKETLTYPVLNAGGVDKYVWKYGEGKYFSTFQNMQYIKDNTPCISGYEWCFLVNYNDGYWGSWYRTININKQRAGSYGTWQLNDPNIGWSGDATMTINGIPYTKTISNAVDSSAEFKTSSGEWIGNIRWIGSLITGQATPNQANFVPTYDGLAGKWRVAPRSYYNAHLNAQSEFDTTLLTYRSQGLKCNAGSTTDGVCDVLETSMTNANKKTSDLLAQDSQVSIYSEGSMTHSTSGTYSSGSVIETTPGMRIANPSFQILVKATRLGVYIPVGMPKIESISIPPFASGDGNGVATVRVKNTGSVIGTFDVTFNDPSGTFFQLNSGSSRASIAAGNYVDISVLISHGASVTVKDLITKRVLFTAKDINKPTNKDEQYADITMTEPKACVPNKVTVEGSLVYKCKTDGTGKVIILDCVGKSPVWNGDEYICSGTPGPTSTPTGNHTGVYTAYPRAWYGSILFFLLVAAVVFAIYEIKYRKKGS